MIPLLERADQPRPQSGWLIAMQKVVGSNPISRFRKGLVSSPSSACAVDLAIPSSHGRPPNRLLDREEIEYQGRLVDACGHEMRLLAPHDDRGPLSVGSLGPRAPLGQLPARRRTGAVTMPG